MIKARIPRAYRKAKAREAMIKQIEKEREIGVNPIYRNRNTNVTQAMIADYEKRSREYDRR